MGVSRGLLHRRTTRNAEFESGSWLIRCGATSHRDELRRHMPGDLLVRQLRRFRRPRLLICSRSAPVDEAIVRELAYPTWLTDGTQVPLGQFDLVWDADVLHEVPLDHRLAFIATLDGYLRVGGSWISVSRDHLGTDPAWGYPLSPEEVTSYFTPAYQVVHQEVTSFGVGPKETMNFATLMFTKRTPISPQQLDLELQSSIEAIATRRRALRAS